MPPRQPEPFYYLEHFSTVLSLLHARDHDLLTACECDFLHEFSMLPLQARALIARLAGRSRIVFCESSLRYPELSDLQGELALLEARGWICTDPVVTMAELFAALPLSSLAAGFGLKPGCALNKERMLGQAQEMYPACAALSSTHFRMHAPLYQFTHAQLCRRLCAQYFGNHRQDWSQYIVADRKLRRYERVNFDAASRPFQTPQEIECFHQLQLCTQMLDSDARTLNAGNLLPETPASCAWLRERHQRVAYRLAQRLEREGDLTAALAIYRSSGSPEADGRVRVVSRKLSRERSRPRLSRRAVPHIDLTLSSGDQQKVEPRVASVLQRMDPDCEVQVMENRLFNALFGLLFWRALFAPVRGAFFHAFHSAPADLYGAQFCNERRTLIDESFEALHSGDHVRAMQVTFQTKIGISNPWIAWRWLRPSILARALQCIPPPHLIAIFQWMLRDLRRHTAGFPDLIQYWPREARYRLLEVKLGADRLQDNQRQFLHYANGLGLPISVCYVTAPAVPAQAMVRRARAAESAHASLNLFVAEGR